MVSRLTDFPPLVRPPVITRPPPWTRLPPPTPDISLPKKLGHPPTAADLIIKRTFDGLTPQAAAQRITAAFRGTIAPQNQRLVDTTVSARVRDMQVALNNVFTQGTPNRKFLEQQLPAAITVIGSLSSSNPIVYEVSRPGQAPKYFTKGWSGGFAELPKPPAQVVMRAQLSLEPMGLRMEYPQWQNRALAGTITTITEG